MDVLPGGVVYERHLGALFVVSRWRYAGFQRLSSQSGRIVSIRQAARCRILVVDDPIRAFSSRTYSRLSRRSKGGDGVSSSREAAGRVLSPPAFYSKDGAPKHINTERDLVGHDALLIVIVCMVPMYLRTGLTLWLPSYLNRVEASGRRQTSASSMNAR
ncbi:hypothetical protein J6497_00890 [Bradyrhizobium sp. CNPSo 4026]|nr:hypothetical protein [Bradyrhizobium cenepequi]MCA6105810.1 hypothetical protein [Bradyrhizobium cenepequi]